VGEEVREVPFEVDVREPVEVALAAEARPLGEDSEGKDLARRQRRWAARSPGSRSMRPLPLVVHQHEEGNEQGLEIHVAPPSGRSCWEGGANRT
jgi:hypothetical protein